MNEGHCYRKDISTLPINVKVISYVFGGMKNYSYRGDKKQKINQI